jgi:hypothetical protein
MLRREAWLRPLCTSSLPPIHILFLPPVFLVQALFKDPLLCPSLEKVTHTQELCSESSTLGAPRIARWLLRRGEKLCVISQQFYAIQRELFIHRPEIPNQGWRTLFYGLWHAVPSLHPGDRRDRAERK